MMLCGMLLLFRCYFAFTPAATLEVLFGAFKADFFCAKPAAVSVSRPSTLLELRMARKSECAVTTSAIASIISAFEVNSFFVFCW